MFSRHLSPLIAVGLSAALYTCCQAKDTTSWDGIWKGAWGGKAQTSVQISGGHVVRYEYRGNPVPVSNESVSNGNVIFGDDNYTITILKVGPRKATASFKSPTLGTAAADLVKQ